MYNEIFYILGLLFVKHWYVDFVNQTIEEVNSKGNYGELVGIEHSFKHGIGTLLVFLFFNVTLLDAMLLSLIDFVIHYHVDWLKININRKQNYTTETKEFWTWLGADQLAHSITYLFLVWLIL